MISLLVNLFLNMYCKHCGEKMTNGAQFCGKCGVLVDNKGPQNQEMYKESSLDVELKRGVYKLENGDMAGAEKIFEDLAFKYNAPMAWVYIGGIKLGQLDSGESTVQQALNCFVKASQINPTSKEMYQSIFCDIATKQIEKFYNQYFLTKKQAGKASRRGWGSLALGGLSLLFANQSQTLGNKMLGGAGGIYGAYRANKNFSNSSNAKQLLSFYITTIKQLVAGVGSFCSDSKNIYQDFLNKTNRLKLA